MKIQNKRILIISFFLTLIIGAIIVGGIFTDSDEYYGPFDLTPRPISYDFSFSDNNRLQLTAADAIGLPPIENDAQYQQAVRMGKLVLIEDCRNYYLRNVKFPHLVPTAAKLLDEIGKRYRENVGDFGSPLRITSATRTNDYQQRLSRGGNANASRNSCHTRGTTIDISYSQINHKEKEALSDVLAALRGEGRCYVIRETKQPCYHITARWYMKWDEDYLK